MCQRNVVTETPAPSVGVIRQLSTEEREQIDWRVINKLAERDYIRQQYMRGFWDCIYIVGFIAWIALLIWQYYGKEE